MVEKGLHNSDDPTFVDQEEVATVIPLDDADLESTEEATVVAKREIGDPAQEKSAAVRNSVLLPLIFVTVALLGGVRFRLGSGEFLFIRPALVCLIFAVILVFLFVRARLIEPDGYFSDRYSTLENASSGILIAALFGASVQVFNSLLPEAGLPFWIVGFCFLWTLWSNIFARFDAKRLLQSLGGVFALAFVVKYMVLLNLTAERSESWWEFLSSGNITAETFSILLAIQPFSPATGYLQFFTIGLYLVGLFLMNNRIHRHDAA